MSHPRRQEVSLHYEQEGRGQPPFVFVHGWCCNHTFFQPQFDHFKSSFRVMAMDLRGCGSSDRAEDGYDIPTLADDVARLCSELGITKPIIVGHSMGGMIAIELAARYPALPAAIVGVDPAAIDPLPQTRRFFEGFLAQLEGPQGDAVRRAFVESMFSPVDDPDRRHRIVETMCAVPPTIAVAGIRGILAWNGVAALLLCNVPLLILRSDTGGSNDPARLLPLKPDVHFGLTVGAGHFHQLEVPDQVTAMIERFVRVVVKVPPN